ncbi:hypothetical protein F5B18DRAFT_635505 [Nemania serpens]|nr:hypothetical protein F5B18DRAFT_635505 [Nemania serpens]
MGIRVHTISLSPFFEIIKSEFLPDEDRLDPIWDQLLEAEVCRATGLQNDLIGLERDLENGEPLNAVLVLMASDRANLPEQGEALFARHIEQVAAEHNRSTAQAMNLICHLDQQIGATHGNEIVETAQHIFLMCETHLKWCTKAKRYSMKTESNPTTTSVS